MNKDLFSYFLALGANLGFATASTAYSHYSQKISVIFVNNLKALVALVGFALSATLVTGWNPVTGESFLVFFISGFIGLCFGDILLLKAFTLLGPARTLMLFGFQPLLLGTASYFFFSQKFQLYRLLAIVFLIACLGTFAYENFIRTKQWNIKALLLALVAVFIDAVGVLLTKFGFVWSPEVDSFEANAYRCLGALFGFFLISLRWPIGLKQKFFAQSGRNRALLVGSSLIGTYLSLFLYLKALQVGHIASITAIAITGPFFASILECCYKRQWPSRHMLIGFALFAVGFLILVLN